MSSLYQIKAKTFLFWWVMASLIAWPLSLIAVGLSAFAVSLGANFMSITYLNGFWGFIMALGALAGIGAIIGWSVALLQRRLLQNRLYWEAEYWQRNSIIGGALGAVLSFGSTWFVSLFGNNRPYAYSYDYYQAPMSLYFVLPIFLLCLSSAQALRLRYAVRHAWLWILGNVSAGMVFSGIAITHYPNPYAYPYESGGNYFFYLIFAALALGFIMGCVILYLFERHITLPMNPHAHSDRPHSVWDEAV